MISLKRYHQTEFQSEQFFKLVQRKISTFRPLYFKYFKMVDVDITMSILGTEVYFDSFAPKESAQYLMRQFTRIPLVNNFVLYEMLDVFGDLIPTIPEFKQAIADFEYNSRNSKGVLSKPIVLKDSIQETMFVESILGELNRRLHGRTEFTIKPF